MLENTNNNWRSMSDQAIVEHLGMYLKQHRLAQNKSQQTVADEAGINRWTLSKIENGESVTLNTFIQILRALQLLDTLQVFEKKPVISPLKLAKLNQQQRKRAGKAATDENVQQSKPDW